MGIISWHRKNRVARAVADAYEAAADGSYNLLIEISESQDQLVPGIQTGAPQAQNRYAVLQTAKENEARFARRVHRYSRRL
jgi:hypothetical protein